MFSYFETAIEVPAKAQPHAHTHTHTHIHTHTHTHSKCIEHTLGYVFTIIFNKQTQKAQSSPIPATQIDSAARTPPCAHNRALHLHAATPFPRPPPPSPRPVPPPQPRASPRDLHLLPRVVVMVAAVEADYAPLLLAVHAPPAAVPARGADVRVGPAAGTLEELAPEVL